MLPTDGHIGKAPLHTKSSRAKESDISYSKTKMRQTSHNTKYKNLRSKETNELTSGKTKNQQFKNVNVRESPNFRTGSDIGSKHRINTTQHQGIDSKQCLTQPTTDDSVPLIQSCNTETEIQVATSLSRNTVFIEVKGKKIQALVDSGASVSCIQKSTFDKINKDNCLQIQPSPITNIVGVGGERHEVCGQVNLSLKISGLNVHQNFIIISQLHHPLILGLDFMQAYQVRIDFHHKIMTIGNDSVTVALACDSKFGYARCIKSTVISPESEAVIPVKISKTQKNETVLLEPIESLQNINLAGAKCVVTTHKGKAVMRVINPTKCAITLSPNRVIANVNVVETQEIYPFTDENVASVDSCHEGNTTHGKVPNSSKPQFDIQNPNLSDQQKEKLLQFLKENSDVFSDSLSDIGKTDMLMHKIETLPGAKPVHQRFYRQDPTKKAETERQTNELLQADLIKRSTSVWNSPVVLVKKKDGSWRFAVDYRKLNQITVPISQPLPRIEDVFDALGESKARIFSTLDLNSAYFQIPLDPETRQKSAFVTHEGVFEFTRMPFGLRNAPMSFQLLMSLVLKGLNRKFVLCYIDDILVFSPNLETHLQHLKEVFQRLRDAKLTLKPSKCKFGLDKVVFLGHVISSEGVSVEPSNTDKVQNFPVPKTQKELRGFLGLCNYYRRFVQNYAKICVPLNALLKQEVRRTFSSTDWTEQCQTAFETLKSMLISPPILQFPDMNKEFVLATDASGGALGYILGQVDEQGREYVISYGGRAIRPEEKKWTTTELECLAIISGIETFRHYLSHRHFTVFTDHSALQWLMSKKEPTGRLARWGLKVLSYNFTVKHKKGTQNQNADAISRIDYNRLPQINQNCQNQSLCLNTELTSSLFVALIMGNKTDNGSLSKEGSNLTNPQQSPKSHMTPKPLASLQADPVKAPFKSDAEGTTMIQNFKCDHNSDFCSENSPQHTEVTFEYQNTPIICNTEREADVPDIATLQRQCDDFKHIISYLESNIVPEDKDLANLVTVVAENQYVLDDNVLYHIYTPRTKKVKEQNVDNLILQVALPDSEREAVLASYHDCKAGGGHFGIKRTFASIKQKYWWPKMYQQIKDYISTCDACQRAKVTRARHPAPLNPLPIEDVFSRVHIDILCSLPKTKEGFQYVLLVVDSFSKWTEAFPLRTQEAKEVANILYNEIFTRYGAPRTIVSDRGRNFMSKLVSALCEFFEVKRTQTSSYHPETNATVERANSTLAQTLRTYINKDQLNWPSLLPSIMMAFRSSPCTESTGFSPYQLVCGRNMNLPIDTSLVPKPSLGANVQQYFEQLISRLKIVKELARSNMENAQAKAKHIHDAQAREPTYNVGDRVLLKKEKIPQGLSTKLTDKFDGPFQITETGPNYTYKLRNLNDQKVMKSLVNAKRLKPYNERQPEVIDMPHQPQLVEVPQPQPA